MSLVLTNYIDCDNNNESLESILKRLIVVDASGNLYVRVVICQEGACPDTDMPVEDWSPPQEPQT